MPRFAGNRRGFSLIELLVAIGIASIMLATTTGFLGASRRFMRSQDLLIEASNNARAAIDVLVRDIRLAGACLPITGDFMSLDGTEGSDRDRIWTRTGLVRPDMSCVRTATRETIPAAGSNVRVDDVSGFTSGMRAYIRNASGDGDYFTITSVSSSTNTLGRSVSFSREYPTGSGVYAIDDRSYYITDWDAPWGQTPQLMLQVNGNTPQSFAIGIEKLDFRYQLRRNCPLCDIVNLPNGDNEWRLVERVLATVTARSDRKGPDGQYARRTLEVSIKPRNLLPQ
jgi:prepilin-type N-terminal cleavage/methylation domain-containing protein